MNLGSIPDWISVMVGVATLIGGGGAGAWIIRRRRQDGDQLVLEATRRATNLMEVRVRYQARHRSSAVIAEMRSLLHDSHTFVAPRHVASDGKPLDLAAIETNKTSYLRLKLNPQAESELFAAKFYTVWPESDGSVSMRIRIEQPPGKVVLRRKIRVGPL